jgi:methionine-rich copper-binding protein CopC
MRKIINALAAGLLGGLLLVGIAHAHAAYLRSEPGADAVVATPPARVDIWFKQELFRRQGENSIRVTGPDGSIVSRGETSIDDDDRTHIWVDLQPGLPAGKYLVEWKNISLEDGHPTEGSFSFTFDPLAQMTSTPMLASSPTSEIIVITSTTPPKAAPPITIPDVPGSRAGPCTAGLLPMLGVYGFVRIRRSHRK